MGQNDIRIQYYSGILKLSATANSYHFIIPLNVTDLDMANKSKVVGQDIVHSSLDIVHKSKVVICDKDLLSWAKINCQQLSELTSMVV